MNILHLISGGEVGGSKNHLITLVKGMMEKGIKNKIVCLMDGELYNEALAQGIDITLIRQNKRFDLSVVGEICDICEENKIDVVNCHGGRANFVGYFLKRKYKAGYVSTIHSDYKDDYRGNLYKTLIYSNINKWVLKKFDYYITVSDTFKEMLEERGFDTDKIHVVYNGIDFNKPIGDFSREEILLKYGLMNSSKFVSMVARFHPVKGHTVFLDACQEVLNYYRDVSFILAGDGDTLEEMKEYSRRLGISNNVYFSGWKNPDEFLFISDFTVLTSFTESFPLAILESAFYGRTVISTEVGGIPKLIEDGINGFLIKPGDNNGLASKMLTLLNNEDKCEEMGRKLYLKAKTNFSIENLVNSYTGVYEKIVGGTDNE